FAACDPTPRAGCVTSATASALIKEAAVGRERLKLSFKGMLGETTRAQFGDPVDGDTRYDICFYDDRRALAGELVVDRGGQGCGPVAKPCWAPIGPRGWRYKDVDATADGVQKILMQSGPSGRGRLLMKAGNAAGKHQTSMPVGFSGHLSGTTLATAQVVASDGACFGAALT